VGNIVLWSNIESAIGLVAGSIPSLRRLIRRNGNATEIERSGTGMPGRTPPVGLGTFGSVPSGRRGGRSHSYKNPTDAGLSVTTIRGDGGDWRRLQDEMSYKENEIHTNHTYEVELTYTPEHKSLGGSSRDSILRKDG
jgi:hypothetical protein